MSRQQITREPESACELLLGLGPETARDQQIGVHDTHSERTAMPLRRFTNAGTISFPMYTHVVTAQF